MGELKIVFKLDRCGEFHVQIVRGSKVLADECGSKPHCYAWANGARARIAHSEGALTPRSPYSRKWGSYLLMPMGARAVHNRWCHGWDEAARIIREE
jgi:hypothetical protein